MNEQIETALSFEGLENSTIELLRDWSKYLKKSYGDDSVLSRVYVIREFALFMKKPLDKATEQDRESFFEFKLQEDRKSLTRHEGVVISPSSQRAFRFRIKDFYRWMHKHTPLQIDIELAYPRIKSVKLVKEVTRAQKCKNQVEGILENRIYTYRKEDKNIVKNSAKIEKFTKSEFNKR